MVLQSVNDYFIEMCSGSEAGLYLGLIDFCHTRLKSNKGEQAAISELLLSLAKFHPKVQGGHFLPA